jgi:3-dehydroquinate synthetase
MVCGYAEILKHAIIKDSTFFKWLKNFSEKILIEKNAKSLSYAIFKSCKIKLSFVTKDIKEKNLRMSLNFGHTFAHAIEAKNNYSGKINHGEAVLIGIILATKLSVLKRVCSKNTLEEINRIYEKNSLKYILSKFDKDKNKNQIFKFMKNDKKNDDEKINFILLKKIGQTYKPGMFKIDSNKIRKVFDKIN